jgi:hypothetical protein
MPRTTRVLVLLTAAALLVACDGLTTDGSDADASRGDEQPVAGTAVGPCDDVLAASAAGAEHVDPGTDMDYEGVPPVSGNHWSEWEDIVKPVYTVEERPDLGQLVHSEEHGWTIVWYDETIDSAELEQVMNVAASEGGEKFVAMPWTSDDGDAFPGGAHVAFTHWGVAGSETEYRQFCAAPDAAAIAAFSAAYPPSDAREPNAP